jgi:succinoglycan biosynthesis transport protein ExoP
LSEPRKLLPAPELPALVNPPGGFFDYWRMLRRRKLAVSIAAITGMAGAAFYTWLQPPVFQSVTTIEVQAVNEDFLKMRDLSPTAGGAAGWDAGLDLQTQVRILQSRALFDRVSKKLGLDKPQPAPAKPRFPFLQRLPGGKTVSASGVRARAQAATRLIEINVDSTDPRTAADFANALVAEFVEQNLEARWQTSRHTGEWLARQMEDVKKKLEKSEDELQAYARETGLIFTQEKDNIAEQKLRQLQEELSKAAAERIARQSRYELATGAPADSIAEVLDDGSLKDIQSKLTDLRRQNAELTSSLTAAHPRVKKVAAQIQELERSLERERGNILNRIRNDFESAQRREKLLAADYTASVQGVSAQAAKVIHYNILKREVDTDRQLYDNMLQRVREAGIASALRASNIRVVDPAVPARVPYKPSLIENMALGTLAWVLLGVLTVILRERVDRTIHEPGDTTMYLGLPELGILPSAIEEPAEKRGLLSFSGPRRPALPHSVELVTLRRKPSVVAESVRATVASILFAGRDGDCPRVLVFSSAGPKEGKTTLATNVALALAEIGRQVLLIDADLRRPRLHRVFEFGNEKGLVDLLRGDEPVEKALEEHSRYSGVPGLWLLTSGMADEGDPALLHSDRFARMLELARNQYEMVLIDAPPMLAIADARVIAQRSDGVILVARANETSRDSLRDVRQRLEEDGTRVLGAVLNDWNPKKSRNQRYYKYYETTKG